MLQGPSVKRKRLGAGETGHRVMVWKVAGSCCAEGLEREGGRMQTLLGAGENRNVVAS